MCTSSVLFFFDLSCYLCCFFFFSSRRRHTRYWRDWSSDVCSSDLAARPHCGFWYFSTNSSTGTRSEEHTSELQSRQYLVCRLLLEKKKKKKYRQFIKIKKKTRQHIKRKINKN